MHVLLNIIVHPEEHSDSKTELQIIFLTKIEHHEIGHLGPFGRKKNVMQWNSNEYLPKMKTAIFFLEVETWTIYK